MKRRVCWLDRTQGAALYVLAATCDLNGCFRGKRVEAASLDKILKNGIRMPMSSIGVDIWGTDVFANSLTLDQAIWTAFCEPGRSAGRSWPGVQRRRNTCADVDVRAETGEPFFGDPRRTLRR